MAAAMEGRWHSSPHLWLTAIAPVLWRGHQLEYGCRKRFIAADDAIRIEGANGRLGITKINRDDRHLCRLSQPDIGRRIADHHSARHLTAGGCHRFSQHIRVWFLHPESVLSANGGEVLRKV